MQTIRELIAALDAAERRFVAGHNNLDQLRNLAAGAARPLLDLLEQCRDVLQPMVDGRTTAMTAKQWHRAQALLAELPAKE